MVFVEPCKGFLKWLTNGVAFVALKILHNDFLVQRSLFANNGNVNKVSKSVPHENKKNYVKQRSHCVSLLRKTKREYYSTLDEKNICDNKTFWKTVKPILSKKIKSNERITLIENDEFLKTEKGTAEVLNAFFSNIVQNLAIQQYNVDDPICENINDPLLKAIVRYRHHPSIVAIKKFRNSKSHFSFKNVQKEEIHKELNNLNINKATQNTKIIKENCLEISFSQMLIAVLIPLHIHHC